MTKAKAKYKVNDVVILKEKNKAAIIDSKDYIPNKGYLYTLKVVGTEPQYKRYYEDRVDQECSKAKNARAIKVLYGNTKK